MNVSYSYENVILCLEFFCLADMIVAVCSALLENIHLLALSARPRHDSRADIVSTSDQTI